MVEILLECRYEDDRILFPEGISEELKWNIFRFFFQGVLDAHLPVAKAIGFSIETSNKIRKQLATERCSSCLENMVQIATNLSDKVFLGVLNNLAVTQDYCKGVLTTEKTKFISQAKEVRMLYTNKDILTAIDDIKLTIYILESTGYSTMEDSSKLMNKASFFPMNTYHSLRDYVRVLPFNGEYIQIRYYNGMSKDLFKTIIRMFIFMLGNNDLKEVDKKWVSNLLG